MVTLILQNNLKQRISTIYMTQDLQHKIEVIIHRDPPMNDIEVVFELQQLLYEVEQQIYTEKKAKGLAELVAENLRQLNEGVGENAVIKTGFEDFDTAFGGFRLGEFVVIGGRPGMGKTQLLINLSLNISISIPVLYITLDLSESLLTNRFIASISGIPAHDIILERINEGQKDKLASLEHEFNRRHLFIYESNSNSIATLKTYCQHQIEMNEVKVIIFDYLQLISHYKYHKFREQEVSHICMELKSIAKRNNVCIITSSQLSRSVENRLGSVGKHPLLSDLKDSGMIEQSADKVLFMHRPEYYKILEDDKGNCLKGVVEIIMAKNRIGAIGHIRLIKDDYFVNLQSVKRH